MTWNIQSGNDVTTRSNIYNGIMRDQLSGVAFTYSPSGINPSIFAFASLAASDNAVYAISNDQKLFAVDFNGNQLWSYGDGSGGGGSYSKLIYKDNYVYCISGVPTWAANGRIARVNATNPYSESVKYYDGQSDGIYFVEQDYLTVSNTYGDIVHAQMANPNGYAYKVTVRLDATGGELLNMTAWSGQWYCFGPTAPSISQAYTIMDSTGYHPICGYYDVMYNATHIDLSCIVPFSRLHFNKWQVYTKENTFQTTWIGVTASEASSDLTYLNSKTKGFSRGPNYLFSTINNSICAIDDTNLAPVTGYSYNDPNITIESGPVFSQSGGTIYFVGNDASNGYLIALNNLPHLPLKWSKVLNGKVFAYDDQTYKPSQTILPIVNNNQIMVTTVSGIYSFQDNTTYAKDLGFYFEFPNSYKILYNPPSHYTWLSSPILAGDALTVFACGSSIYGLGMASVRNYIRYETKFHGRTASFVSDGGVGWNWDFGDGTTSTEQNPTHVYATDDVYTVCLTAYDLLSGSSVFCSGVNVQKYDNNSVLLREYEKLFIGTNQDDGYENPILSFTADTIQQIIKSDAITYFHYPYTATQTTLSSVGLIEAGAVSGPCPYYSDKIWKKMADYKSYVNWGDASPTIRQTGVWLCVWLSGNEYNPSLLPVWKERWYNPGYIDLSGAYTATTPISDTVIDLDSSLTMDPGVLYKYYHAGNEKNLERIESINLSGELRAHFENWTPYFDTVFYKVSDVSGYSNNGIIENYASNITSNDSVNPIELPDDNTLNLSGTGQHVKIVYNDNLNLKDKVTVSIWAKAKDWNNIQGNHIVSNNFRGGWDINYSNGFSTPFLSFFNEQAGTILISNTDRTILTTKQVPGSSAPVGIAIDGNRYTWLLDNGIFEDKKNLFKIDFTGDILTHTLLPSTLQMQDLAIDEDNNTWLLMSGQLTGVNMFGVPVSDSEMQARITSSSIISAANARKLDITKDNKIKLFNCDDVCFDEDSNAWVLSSGNVYKESSLIYSGISATNIACDSNNNIWVLYGDTQFVKLSSTGNATLSGSVSETIGLCSRSITLTNEYTGTRYEDFVWISQVGDGTVFKVNENGIVVKKLNVSNFDNFIPCANGDASGYDWGRKFSYLKYNKQPQIQTSISLGTNLVFGQKKTLTFPTSALVPDDWHMFTFTYDSSADQFDFYVDSVLRESVSTLSSAQIYYEYENPIIVGGNVGHTDSLGVELKLNQFYFKGGIDDLRIYDRVLNISDIRRIYLSKYLYKDLIWNMPTGRQNYLEEVERFFKFKLPGQKSQYYNIRFVGSGINDLDVRMMIEDIVRGTVKKIAPAHAELLNVLWE